MTQFHIAENLTKLRRYKGITQEKLADFLGVSKASVSKWETGQSLPDIAQLPRLAAFYDVTIDELMGYEPQLSMGEIRKFYERFSEKFVTNGFEETLSEIRNFIRMYYSCDLAVLQMVALLMNHLMLTDEDTRSALLEEMVDLCKYVEGHCEDVNISNSAVVFHANLELMRANATEVIAKLENRKDPFHIMGGADVLLIQAYQVAGQLEESKEWNQVVIYREVLCLVQESLTYLMNHMSDKECAKETINRITAIVDAYQLKTLHPNTYLQFIYAKAMYYMMSEEISVALAELQEFVSVAIEFLTDDVILKGDAYFDKLDGYFAKMEEYMVIPRNPQLVLSTLAQELQHPVFAPLFEIPEYQKLLERLK